MSVTSLWAACERSAFSASALWDGVQAGAQHGVCAGVRRAGLIATGVALGSLACTVVDVPVDGSGVAMVQVHPDSTTVPIQGSWPFTATLLDQHGNPLSKPITWVSGDSTIATVSSAGVVTGVSPGSTTITATAEGKSGSGGVSVAAPGTGPWPNEPTGFPVIADNPFSLLDGDGWQILDTTAGLVTLTLDLGAPLSAPSVLQYAFPIGFEGGIGPGAEWYHLPDLRQVFVGTWWKVSNPWQGHGSNVNKIQILFPGNGGDIYMVMYGSPGGPYEIRVIPQFLNMPSEWLRPNVNDVPVTLGAWHRIEWLLVYNTTSNPPNGIIRWWLDGRLIGDYNNVAFPPAPFTQYKVSAIWGGVGETKTELDFYWYDHVHISGR